MWKHGGLKEPKALSQPQHGPEDTVSPVAGTDLAQDVADDCAQGERGWHRVPRLRLETAHGRVQTFAFRYLSRPRLFPTAHFGALNLCPVLSIIEARAIQTDWELQTSCWYSP